MLSSLKFTSYSMAMALLLVAGCSAKEAEKPGTQDSVEVAAKQTPDKLTVYYFHTSFRCWTCNQFEKLTKEILAESFAEEQKKGTVELKVVNIEEESDKHFVSDYRLVTKSIVLSLSSKGAETEWENLDKIWELVRNTDKFKEYVTKHLQAQVDKLS